MTTPKPVMNDSTSSEFRGMVASYRVLEIRTIWNMIVFATCGTILLFCAVAMAHSGRPWTLVYAAGETFFGLWSFYQVRDARAFRRRLIKKRANLESYLRDIKQ